MTAWRRRGIAVVAGFAIAGLGLGVGILPADALQSTGDGTWVWQNPLPDANLIVDISCPAPESCVAAEQTGGLARSTDSGTTWSWSSSGATVLFGASCFDLLTCYAVGANGVIAKTTDGSSWSQQTSGTTWLLRDISCPSATMCFAVGDNGSLATTDGGASWKVQLASGNGISCPTTTVCYAVGSQGHIIGTVDGGTTWKPQNSTSTTEVFTNISCPLTTTCFAVSAGGNVFRTADGGTTWQQQSTANPSLYSISCPTTSVCLAAAGNTIVSTSDGGVTWTSASDTGWSLKALSCASTTVCYTAGLGGMVLRTADGGTSWTRVRPTGVINGLFGVSCPADGTCFSVGGARTILATTNGGQTWSPQTSPSPGDLFGVSCADVNTCVAVSGSGGTIIGTTNRGSNWTQLASISGVGFQAISCPSTSVCFAVGFNGAIRATTDGGATWVAQTSNTTQDILAISCVSTQVCHTAGFGSTILATSNGGTTWTSQSPGTVNTLFGVTCPTLSTCYAVGYGNVAVTNDGGTNWSHQSFGTSMRLNAVGCRSATDCVAVGYETIAPQGASSTIIATTDGSTWTRQAAGSDVLLRAVACRPIACWVVGYGGAILTGPVSMVDAAASSVVSSAPFVPADGSSKVVVTVSLKNAAGNPVPGKSVRLAKVAGPGSPTIDPPSGITNAAGQVSFNVSSSNAGRDNFQATVPTESVALRQTVDITFTGPRRAVLPALANAAYGGYGTSVYVQNVSVFPATVAIGYFDQAGHFVGSGDVISSLPPGAGWTVPQSNGHSFPSGAAGSAVIFSDQPVGAFVNEFAPGNASDATSYTAILSPGGTGSTLFAPAIASRAYGGYTTGIGLINLSAAATDITITYRDVGGITAKTQTLTGVPAGAYRGVYSGDSGSPTDANLPADFAGTATITSSTGQPLAAVVNEVGPGGQFSSYDAVPAGSTTLQAPVALNNAFGGYYTGIGVQNTTGTAGTVTLRYFDSAGAATTRTFAIAANGYVGIYQGSPTDGPAPGPYTAQISSGVAIAAIVNEVAPPGSGGAQQSTAYNTFAGGARGVSLPLVENAGSDGWSTGLGIMNTGTAVTSVTVTYYDAATGAAVGTAQTNSALQPNAFWAVYQPTAGLPAGQRATAVVQAAIGGKVAVICNETNATSFMSYDAQ